MPPGADSEAQTSLSRRSGIRPGPFHRQRACPLTHTGREGAPSNFLANFVPQPNYIARCDTPPLVGNLLSHGTYPPSEQAGKWPQQFVGQFWPAYFIARCDSVPLVGNLLSHGTYPPSEQAGKCPQHFFGQLWPATELHRQMRQPTVGRQLAVARDIPAERTSRKMPPAILLPTLAMHSDLIARCTRPRFVGRCRCGLGGETWKREP